MKLPYNIRLPKNLNSVATAGTDEEAPETAGLSPRAVNAVWGAVKDVYRSAAYPALTFCLRRRGHVVLNRALGHSSGNGPRDPAELPKQLVRPETPICIFSASKAVTAVLVHKLAEDGGIDLDHRVSQYLPEFVQNGKRDTTVANVLSHQGGFPMFDLPAEAKRADTLLDWPKCVSLICEAPPAHRGAPRMAYHAITGGFILGEIIQRVTGRTLSAYLDTTLRQPLGMKTFTYGLAPEHRNDVALNYVAGTPAIFPISRLLERALVVPIADVVAASNSSIFMDAVVPAGNIHSTAEELSRFYQLLLDGGVYQGKRVLREDTIERMVRPACRLQFDHTLKIPMRYSEGFMLGAGSFGLFGPMTPQAYGHLGFMNILGWADPARELSASLLVTGKAVLGPHLLALGELLTVIAWQCRRQS